jgi:hypothetical protein
MSKQCFSFDRRIYIMLYRKEEKSDRITESPLFLLEVKTIFFSAYEIRTGRLSYHSAVHYFCCSN